MFNFNWYIRILLVLGRIFYYLFLNPLILDGVILGYSLNLSILSFRLILLRIWVSLIILISRYKVVKNKEFDNYFNFFILILLLILIVTFSVGDFIFFYFFFEASLIPTLLIIIGWGYNPERLQAGLYFLFYTLGASLPLLLIIIFIGLTIGSFRFYLIDGLIFNFKRGVLIFFAGLIFRIAFIVKLPIFIVHLWLPKAHVEAPVAGSIILAGVLLKLGGYGLINLSIFLFSFYIIFGGYFIGLSLIGMMVVGFICLRTNDFKALVAYSSVSHIRMVVSGVVSYYIWGFRGSLIIIIGHGLSSSGLFSIVNIYYERLGRRSFFINKGLLLILPIFSFCIFILAAANIAAPPTINLLSEILLIGRILRYDYFILLVFPLGSFIGAVFTLYIYSYRQHGRVFNLIYGVIIIKFRELHVLIIHIIPVNLIIIRPSFFILY